MGKAARRQRREQEAPPVYAPTWAGANGFDQAWKLTERYLAGGQARGPDVEDKTLESLHYCRELANIKITFTEIQLGLLHHIITIHEEQNPEKPKVTPSLKKETPSEWLDYHHEPIQAISKMGTEHQQLLQKSTPLLFDPSMVPSVDSSALKNLRLPFPYVTCDFLADTGMCMPITANKENHRWIGLIGATIWEPHPGVFDIWPIVTLIDPDKSEHHQQLRPYLHGFVRIGANAPLSKEAPPGMLSLGMNDWQKDDMTGEQLQASCWCLKHRQEIADQENKSIEDIEIGTVGEGPNIRKVAWDEIWAGLLVLQPAVAALGALTVLEAVNVEIEDAALSRPVRRRAERHGSFIPAKEVVIRTKHRQPHAASDNPQSIDWKHRWTVRGHWKHFSSGPVFRANPRKRVQDREHGECVKVWCPPFIKGPEEMPLILKSRRVVD